MTTRLLVLHPIEDRVLLVDGALPVVEDPFAAGVTVLRTLRRDGDDRIVLAEARDDRGTWGHHDLLSSVDDGVARERWQERGWLDGALRWIEEVTGGVTGAPVQLRHWGLSAVLRVGDVVLKEVPTALAHEGRITRALSEAAPGRVPTVLAVDGNRFLMEAFAAADRSVEPDGLLALGQLQRDVLASVDAPDRRLERLADDAAALTPEVLRDDGYDLAPTDGRLPPRAITDADLDALAAMIDRLPGDIARLPPLPDTIVHGDFHVGNVAWVEGRCLLFDWGIASVSHPFMDLPIWAQWAATGEAAYEPYFGGWGVDVHWPAHRHVALLFLAVTCVGPMHAVADPRGAHDWAAGAQTAVLRALAATPRPTS